MKFSNFMHARKGQARADPVFLRERESPVLGPLPKTRVSVFHGLEVWWFV